VTISYTASLTVALSSVSSDAHTWNLVYLQMLLEEQGWEVHNLGPCVSDDLMVECCLALAPDALVISSVNGHGFLDAGRVIRRLRARRELRSMPCCVGGKLTLNGALSEENRRDLIDAGFDRVFSDDSANELISYLSSLVTLRTPEYIEAYS